jgi:hypothetical protein
MPIWRKAFSKAQVLGGAFEKDSSNHKNKEHLRYLIISFCSRIVHARNIAAEVFASIEEELESLSMHALRYALFEKLTTLSQFSSYRRQHIDSDWVHVESAYQLPSSTERRKLAKTGQGNPPKVCIVMVLQHYVLLIHIL